ncbi:MAG: VOC family protein, partial [Vicinamibacteraceae bacterium]
DGTAMHAELKLRDSVLMLGPEMASQKAFSAQTIGGTPATLYIYVDDVDQATDRAAKAGAQILMPATDMFWGDRTSQVADPDGNKLMLATHKSEPTMEEMDTAMKQMAQGAS